MASYFKSNASTASVSKQSVAVVTAWHVLRLRMDETASRYGQ